MTWTLLLPPVADPSARQSSSLTATLHAQDLPCSNALCINFGAYAHQEFPALPGLAGSMLTPFNHD